MKAFFVVVLSAAALLSGISAEAQAIDSRGFDARGICRRPEGCVVDHGQGGSYNGPRNYRNFNGRNERDGSNDRERNNRRYRSHNRSDNFDAGITRLAAGAEIELGVSPMHISV
ncbi:hypothetical protein [Rhizobium ruizarguesonis]|jgi:hypothetical protein|uniref:hypothetical protein n=1 Tax=Rhizobium ruizarguesonis TaxID=2081791 RepID=UPI001031DCEA|nr:hypothetical protein [Rhizobium ruizarguesonis]TBY71169.1 hypothetical protein E0H46_05660 [Rhizobium leguminosarum bv. viciae]MBC2803541.1 hypothetical protein [Rhizobium ruizarguesonis]NKQ84250.1 hypothetical protein [Rhizobium ruizarguesonis]TAT83573.1 hypothetical protein ELI52_08765 [Rhizobium ruizarguesonis]TAW56372.1 hypothetical protein ELI17_08480 [Rhizobium ruizarguesonis]